MSKHLWQSGKDSIWKVGAFDRLDWERACEIFAGEGATDNPLADADDYISRKIGGGHLIKDAFHLLHKRTNEKRAHVPANLQATEKVIDMAQNMGDELDAIKSSTVGKKLESAMAARDLATRLAKKLPRDLKNGARSVEQAQEKLDAATDSLDEILDALDAELAEAFDISPDEIEGAYDEKIGDANGLMDKLKDELEAALAELDETASSTQGAIGLAVKGALEETDEQLEQVLAFVKSFTEAAGGDCSGGIDLEALKWAKKALKHCPAMNDFAELLGWGQRTMRGLWRDSLKAKADPSGIKPKAYDPQKVVMTEQAALQGGYGIASQVDARIRMTEDKLLHFHREGGEEQEGLGDVWFLIDVSGSMSNREIQTIMAIAWGMIEACRRDDRGFGSIQFAGCDQYEAWQAPRKGDPADPEGLYNSLRRKFSGGTEPYQPLEYALNCIMENGQSADVVLFTDGYFATPGDEILAKIVEVQQVTSTRIFTVNSGDGNNTEAEKFSDLAITVQDLYGSREKLIELMKSIV